MATKTHYEALFVGRTCVESEIKVNYRKLALRFHPDKCNSPSAEDAFKTISAAYATLMDAKQRQIYDIQLTTGGGAQSGAARAARFTQQGFTFSSGGAGGAQFQEFNAEDLFQFFFNTNNNNQQYQYRRQQAQPQRRQQQQGDDVAWQQFLHFVPLLVMLFFTFLSILPSQEPPAWSLQRGYRYNVPLTTPNLNVPFYVSSEMKQTLSRNEAEGDGRNEKYSFKSIFEAVESERVSGLQGHCHKALSTGSNKAGAICDEWRSAAKKIEKP
jgi:curved DNA-binding protein CbpA